MLNNGVISVGALSYGAQPNSGWHLLGNPYPAPLDWNQARTGLPAGVIDAVYVYKSSSQYAGTYQFYQNGFGTLPGGLIPAMQGFFLRVSQNVPSFSFQNSWRVTGYQNPTFNRPTADTRPAVQLDLVDAKGTREPAFLYFEAGATPGRDDHYDAEKLPNTTGLNLASVATTGEALAVNGLPALGSEVVVVPLTVDVPQAGRFALAAASLANLPASTLVELVDNQTGTRHDLRQLPAAGYAFTADSRRVAGRFVLNLRPGTVTATGPAALAAQVRAYPNPAQGQLTISRPAGGPASAVLLNAIGQQLRTVALPTTETTVSLQGLPTGVYALRVTLAGGQTVVQRVVVQ
ncbi:T9SS type A sorting domain-containing protein [Hymenobacter aerophilus]|uniref:T9SS type A sorting domain-containing protein n=1 Tax=Hymenobacter aerophilus TaxID=119644 RepID=UPI001F0ABC6E|nr:T9SS type A sorting domain-containing protein [Hymenobacter aerophilus]